MGAKERRQAMRNGAKMIDTMRETSSGVIMTDQDLEEFASDLSQLADEIVSDFTEQRDNLSETPGLLQRWEENYSDQADQWDTVLSNLESYVVEFDVEGDLDVEAEIERIVEMWEEAEQ